VTALFFRIELKELTSARPLDNHRSRPKYLGVSIRCNSYRTPIKHDYLETALRSWSEGAAGIVFDLSSLNMLNGAMVNYRYQLENLRDLEFTFYRRL